MDSADLVVSEIIYIYIYIYIYAYVMYATTRVLKKNIPIWGGGLNKNKTCRKREAGIGGLGKTSGQHIHFWFPFYAGQTITGYPAKSFKQPNEKGIQGELKEAFATIAAKTGGGPNPEFAEILRETNEYLEWERISFPWLWNCGLLVLSSTVSNKHKAPLPKETPLGEPWLEVPCFSAGGSSDHFLGVTSNSTLSRDPDLSRKPPNTLQKWLVLENNDD